MKVEHEIKTKPFESKLFRNILTTPSSEWRLVFRAWHGELNFSTNSSLNSSSSRRLLSKKTFQEMGILKKEHEEDFDKSDDQATDQLREEEVISVVLASGPMVWVYISVMIKRLCSDIFFAD